MLPIFQKFIPKKAKAYQPVIYSVPPQEGRRLAIPDIHGCIDSFNALLDQVRLDKRDQLFLLGDYISKGPHSRKVLDKIIALQKKGFPVYCIRGNHEQMLMGCLEETPYQLRWLAEKLGFTDLLTWRGGVRAKHIRFLKSLPYAYILDDYILVHAGLNFNKPDPLDDLDSMLWIRFFDYIPDKVNGRRIVHGHTPIALAKVEKAISQQRPVIKLDNGCVYRGEREGQGALLCYDLDTEELWKQDCLDK